MESVEDYEYLAMLSDKVAAMKSAGRDAGGLERLLSEAPGRAMPRETWLKHNTYNFFKAGERYDWLSDRHDHAAMDAVRIDILRALSEAAKFRIISCNTFYTFFIIISFMSSSLTFYTLTRASL